LPEVPLLHVSDESPWSGVSVPVQENPYEPGWHPPTDESGPQVVPELNGMQQ
jgi:hypothetical protein